MSDVKFNDMTIRDKSMIVGEYGVYLFTLFNQGKHKIHLHSLHRNFVETWEDERTKAITDIKIISLDELDKFLELISLKSLKLK